MNDNNVDLSGLVLQSNGTYEPTHWYYCLIKKTDTGYKWFDVNNFNIASVTNEELRNGYKIVSPLEAFRDLKDFTTSLIDAQFRWCGIDVLDDM